MKYIIIQGDGMADLPVPALDMKTPLQAAHTPWFDYLARNGKNGMFQTIPDGFPAGSEVGNLSILGYDVSECFEGRGPLEAASMGYDMQPDDLAMRCNLIAVDEKGNILNHHADNITTEEGRELINFLEEKLGGEGIHFYPGIHYRHLLVIKGGKKGLNLYPPHNHVGESVKDLLQKTMDSSKGTEREETVKRIVELTEKSSDLLASHPINIKREKEGKHKAGLIWAWSEGNRPAMLPLTKKYPYIKSGVMITAVDLLKGIGRYAGLEPIAVEGATGLSDTNYEGKALAAINALKDHDLVFVHVEATDEASHDRDISLKIKTIEYLDSRLMKPIVEAVEKMPTPVRIALLPDHPTSVVTGKHLNDPVPFVIYEKGCKPDGVTSFNEKSAFEGEYGMVKPTEFINLLLGE